MQKLTCSLTYKPTFNFLRHSMPFILCCSHEQGGNNVSRISSLSRTHYIIKQEFYNLGGME